LREKKREERVKGDERDKGVEGVKGVEGDEIVESAYAHRAISIPAMPIRVRTGTAPSGDEIRPYGQYWWIESGR
jgi:hypothetical protein